MFILKNMAVAILALFLIVVTLNSNSLEAGMNKEHVLLLGASVGAAWKIGELPDRIKNQDYVFEYVGVYSFDKTQAVNEIVSRQQNKPDVLILKECAAYFPGNFSHYNKLITQWVETCRNNKIIPVLTTVVPVTKPDFMQSAKDLIKGVTGRGTAVRDRQRGIEEYNDWVREFARSNGLVVLDLEKSLRVSDQDRHLDDDLDSGDGLHLNRKAYGIIDKIVIPTLERIKWEE